MIDDALAALQRFEHVYQLLFHQQPMVLPHAANLICLQREDLHNKNMGKPKCQEIETFPMIRTSASVAPANSRGLVL